jgi:alkylation response protein AidB-like acyl-CoA dehydrogenase
MRGTGTHHFEVNDVFVPEARTVLTSGVPRIHGGHRYLIRHTLTFAAGDGAIALGIARSCLDAYFELAGSKAPRHLTGLLRDQSISQFIVGQGEALWRGGRAFLMEAVDDIWDEAVRTGNVSMEKRVVLRLAGTHAIRVAAQIIENVYGTCGGNTIFEGDLIQRHFQDIHVITQHLQGRLAYYELVGQHYLGLPIDEGRL